MDLGCARITKVILPAIRASVAESLMRDEGYTQEEIARSLGVAQVAVSKYLNGHYSDEVARMKQQIRGRKLDRGIVRGIVHERSPVQTSREIDALCARIFKMEMQMVN